MFKFFVRYLELAFPLWRTTRIHAIILKPFFQYLISIWTRIKACCPVFGRPVMVNLCNDGDWNLAFLFLAIEHFASHSRYFMRLFYGLFLVIFYAYDLHLLLFINTQDAFGSLFRSLILTKGLPIAQWLEGEPCSQT